MAKDRYGYGTKRPQSDDGGIEKHLQTFINEAYYHEKISNPPRVVKVTDDRIFIDIGEKPDSKGIEMLNDYVWPDVNEAKRREKVYIQNGKPVGVS